MSQDETFVDQTSISGTARACGVLVDAEPKVVTRIASELPCLFSTQYGKRNVLYNQNGRGNNWALGYSISYKEKADDQCIYE